MARYEAGERFYRRRWMTVDEESRLRAEHHEPWTIDTDHYHLTTNHKLEDGVALATQLELLHSVWLQLFANYVFDAKDLARRLAAGEPDRREETRHNVVYFHTRKEYEEEAQRAGVTLSGQMTLGVYLARTRTAYFYADDFQQPGTVYHEGTHQLFQESRTVSSDVGRDSNFWIVEGIACYLESLEERPGYVTLGAY